MAPRGSLVMTSKSDGDERDVERTSVGLGTHPRWIRLAEDRIPSDTLTDKTIQGDESVDAMTV